MSSCPFCNIAAHYPPINRDSNQSQSQESLLQSGANAVLKQLRSFGSQPTPEELRVQISTREISQESNRELTAKAAAQLSSQPSPRDLQVQQNEEQQIGHNDGASSSQHQSNTATQTPEAPRNDYSNIASLSSQPSPADLQQQHPSSQQEPSLSSLVLTPSQALFPDRNPADLVPYQPYSNAARTAPTAFRSSELSAGHTPDPVLPYYPHYTSDQLTEQVNSGEDPYLSTRTDPNTHLILSTESVLAILDIAPMTPGHCLVINRAHKEKLSDLTPEESAEVGRWLPVLSRVMAKAVGVTDWNVVQNNGPRAAQIVPHVHFHLIPRPGSVPSIKSRSWTMFGKGQRGDLDEEEGQKLAKKMRGILREELEGMAKCKL